MEHPPALGKLRTVPGLCREPHISARLFIARPLHASPLACFGTGKLGDLATYASGVVLAMIEPPIGNDRDERLLYSGPIAYGDAIAIIALALALSHRTRKRVVRNLRIVLPL